MHALRHKINNLIIIMHHYDNYDSTQLSRTGHLIQTKRFSTNNLHYIYDSSTFQTIPTLYEQRGGKRIISLEHTKHTDINTLQPSRSINQSIKKLNHKKNKSILFPQSQRPSKNAKNETPQKSKSTTLPVIPLKSQEAEDPLVARYFNVSWQLTYVSVSTKRTSDPKAC